MEFSLGYIGGTLLSFAAILAVASLIGAFTLRVATKISSELEATADLRPSFTEAYKISFLAGLAAFAISFALGLVVGFVGKDFNFFGYILLVAIGFFANAAVISVRLKHPETGKVSFGRACWLTAIQVTFYAIAAILLVKLFQLITT